MSNLQRGTTLEMERWDNDGMLGPNDKELISNEP